MIAFLAALFLFLAVVAAAVWLFTPRSRKEGESRIRELRPAEASEASTPKTPTSKRSRSSIPTLQRLLSNSEWADSTALSLEQARVQLRVGEYLLVRIALALVGFGLVALILQFSTWGILLGLLAGIVGFMGPAWYVSRTKRRRTAALERQLIDFLPALSSAVRGGFSFQQGIEHTIDQTGEPLREELLLLINDVNLGGTMQQALLDMSRRSGSDDLDMMVTAILVQRTTGGNLAEVLDTVAETLRERERIQGEILSLTASQRLTGVILSVWPAAIGLLLLVLAPDLWSKMFTTTLGIIFLSIAVGLQFIGFLLVRRAVDIKV
jgi:tight adherence protein B